jgi:hypothetical protein
LIVPVTIPVTEAPRVSFNYGFSGDVGAGPYNRFDSVAAEFDRAVTWPAAVSQELPPVPGQIFPTLTAAVDAWNQRPAGEFGVIAMLDSGSYAEDLTGPHAITLPEGSRLIIVAADWPEVRQPGGLPGATTLAATDLDPDELRPHLQGDLEIEGAAPADSEIPGELILNGLFVEGEISVRPGRLGRLSVAHSTVVPGGLAISVEAPQGQLTLTLLRAICGAVELPAPGAVFSAIDSILDVDNGVAANLPEAAAVFRGCTVFGEVRVQRVEAENCLFNDLVLAARQQEGCVRFCLVSTASVVPRRYRCQPALALAQAASTEEEAAIEARLRPSYTARQPGHPAYAQLAATCAVEIRRGADDGSEMGVFHFLKQPQRESNLTASIEPFLRFSLEAGFIYAT